jgi:hypothetical protein
MGEITTIGVDLAMFFITATDRPSTQFNPETGGRE